jgi:predicted dienelactone hydrolase
MDRSRNVLVICVIGVLLVVSACSGSPAAPAASAGTGATAPASVTPAPPATQDASAAAPTAAPTATTPPTPAATLDPTSYALAEPGPYGVGYRAGLTATDAGRGDRSVGVTVWYPAQLPPGFSGETAAVNAEPDRGGAPYPVILSSTKLALRLAPLVVSHGFVWAGVDGIDSYATMNPEMIQQPRDILFALDMVASSPPAGLEGMADTDHAGVTGYSFDGYNAYALGGARIDPEYYLAQCPTPDATTEAILGDQMSAFGCGPAKDWDAFAAKAGAVITTSDDGLWQPMTDPRIRAVMPMAGEGWWLFGERGLAAADRPTLVIVATGDDLYAENALMFDHLGTPEKALISFVGPDHMMVFDPEMQARMAHFAAAFFGYHLQGREDLAWFFSEAFVAGHPELAWGTIPGK